ncbi:PPOX class F420-dependent oxidoreductase [bacterium]|nr:PPOX class F420-dependent oxidoreductase [bacterium]
MQSQYLNLKTFRKDGRPVATPMWFVETGEGSLLMQTWAGSAKVKRVRNQEKVEVAPSDARGKESGPARSGRCRVHAPDSEWGRRADRLLSQRYGWKRKLVNLLLWLMKRRDKVYLEVQFL